MVSKTGRSSSRSKSGSKKKTRRSTSKKSAKGRKRSTSKSASKSKVSQKRRTTKSSTGGKRKRPEGKPKRALSAWAWFIKKNAKSLKDSSNLSATEVMKELAKEWEGMSESEKDHYVQLAEKDKKRSAKERAQWKAANKGPETAYQKFFRKHRPQVAADHPEFSFGDITREVAAMWRERDGGAAMEEFDGRKRKRKTGRSKSKSKSRSKSKSKSRSKSRKSKSGKKRKSSSGRSSSKRGRRYDGCNGHAMEVEEEEFEEEDENGNGDYDDGYEMEDY